MHQTAIIRIRHVRQTLNQVCACVGVCMYIHILSTGVGGLVGRELGAFGVGQRERCAGSLQVKLRVKLHVVGHVLPSSQRAQPSLSSSFAIQQPPPGNPDPSSCNYPKWSAI